MKIYLIRHGESTSDVDNLFGGWYDDHLTVKGWEQARELAKKLEEENQTEKFQALFCSPFLRAKETAKIVVDKLKLPVKVIEDLKERNNYGFLTGKNKDWAGKKYPETVQKLQDYNHSIKGSENYTDFKKRVVKSFREIITENKQLSKIIITHGGVIKCLLREIYRKKNVKDLPDCGIIEVRG